MALRATFSIRLAPAKSIVGYSKGVVDIEVAHLVREQSTAYDVAFIDCKGGYPYPFIPDLFESPNSD